MHACMHSTFHKGVEVVTEQRIAIDTRGVSSAQSTLCRPDFANEPEPELGISTGRPETGGQKKMFCRLLPQWTGCEIPQYVSMQDVSEAVTGETSRATHVRWTICQARSGRGP